MAAANAGFSAWSAAEQLGNLAQALGQNPAQALSQGVSVSLTYGEQKSVETQHAQGNTVEQSRVNAGGKVRIQTEGGGKESNLTIVGSTVSGKGGTELLAEGNINALAVDENHLERSKNKSSGFNAGIAASYGSNGFAIGVTAGGNVAKGYGNGESRAWTGSQIGTKESRTTLVSGKDLNMIGSQALGRGVKVKAENLNIESLQDTMKYEGKQESVSGQVTVGYGASAQASYSKSKMKADMASVQTQAGIYTGDEGYQIEIDNQTDLKGGLITSTAKAEAEGKNRFSTGTLTHSDIENHADYKGSAVSVSGSVAMNFDTPLGEHGAAQSHTQAVNNNGEKLYTDSQGRATTEAVSNGQSNTAVLAKGLDSLELGGGLGFGQEKESQHSVTKSGINTQNITIRDKVAQQEKTGKAVEETLAAIHTTVTTETAETSSGKLENHFDKAALEKELNYQVGTTRAFSSVVHQAVEGVAAHQAESKRAEATELDAQGKHQQAETARNEAKAWEVGGNIAKR